MRPNVITFLLILVAVAFFAIMLPFWKSFVMGLTVAIVFYPLFGKIKELFKNSSVASFVSICVVLLIIALPITVAIYIMVNETEKFLGNVKQVEDAFSGFLVKVQAILHIKLFTPYIDKLNQAFFSLLQNIGILITKNVGAIFSQTYKIVANFIFSFIIAFYFIRDGHIFLDYISSMIDDKEGFYRILKSIRNSINATVLGGVVTALVQGAVGAIGFLIVGLNAFFMWLFLIAIFSFVPLVGTAIIWVPVALYQFISGSLLKGIFIMAWGALAVGMVDNYVRPLVISSKINIHPMVLFFGILGSITVFGPIGIILGPVIISVGDVLIKSYVANRSKGKSQ